MRWIRVIRVAAAVLTIVITLSLVVADAMVARDLLTPTRLKLLFGFIGLLLGLDVALQRATDFQIDVSVGGGDGNPRERERERDDGPEHDPGQGDLSDYGGDDHVR